MRLWIVLCTALGACASAGAKQPLAAVDAYAAALRAGDYGRAYELMSARYRREHTREEFMRMMKDSPQEVKETASRLTASGRKVEATRKVDPELVGGMILQAGSLRVDASVRGRLERLRHELITR